MLLLLPLLLLLRPPVKKNVNIYVPAGKSVFYANFRVKRKHRERGLVTVQVNRSTGSASRAVAQRIANAMRDAEMEGLFLPKLRENCATVGDIIERFTARAKIRSTTAVVLDFLAVVAEGAGILEISQRDKARAIRLSALTAASMLAFRDRSDGAGGYHRGRSVTSINKLMRSARSMFSRRAMEYYSGLTVPDLSGWLGVSFLPEPKNKRFRRIPDEKLAAMDSRAGMMLRAARIAGRDTPRGQRWRNGWACFQLMRRCGLRNDEVASLRREWFTKDSSGRWWIELIERPYWKPKGSSGRVPIAADLHAALMAEFPSAGKVEAENDFLLAGPKTARWDGTHIEVNSYVRRFLPDGRKGAYQLRKQWGSEMARRHGLETAASLLRHSGTQTAWDHYFDDLKLRDVEAL